MNEIPYAHERGRDQRPHSGADVPSPHARRLKRKVWRVKMAFGGHLC
jgi:hypothetical protein